MLLNRRQIELLALLDSYGFGAVGLEFFSRLGPALRGRDHGVVDTGPVDDADRLLVSAIRIESYADVDAKSDQRTGQLLVHAIEHQLISPMRMNQAALELAEHLNGARMELGTRGGEEVVQFNRAQAQDAVRMFGELEVDLIAWLDADDEEILE